MDLGAVPNVPVLPVLDYPTCAGGAAVDDFAAGHLLQTDPVKRTTTSGFVGHDMSSKGSNALRFLAFQGQSRVASPDPVIAARRFGEYMQRLCVDLALVTETGLRDGSDTLSIFK